MKIARRFFLAGAASLAGLRSAGAAFASTSGSDPYVFHVSVGRDLFSYRLDEARAQLSRANGPFAVAEEVQSAWQARSSQCLYVASSDNSTTRKDRHVLSAMRIGEDGVLVPLSEGAALSARPIDVAAVESAGLIVVAYNSPPAITVHRMGANGDVGDLLQRIEDVGVYPHQVRASPCGRILVVPARGNEPTQDRAEDVGSIHVFSVSNEGLAKTQVLSPGGGRGFRPRHADFSPDGSWVYVNSESQNELHAFAITDGLIAEAPSYVCSTLASPDEMKTGQLVSALRLSPDGQWIYVVNRGNGTVVVGEERVSNGGENSIAVFRRNERTGEPTLVQSLGLEGIHARTMTISPDGRWIVAACIRPAKVLERGGVREVAAGLRLCERDRSGRLSLRQRVDLDASNGPVFWVGCSVLI